MAALSSGETARVAPFGELFRFWRSPPSASLTNHNTTEQNIDRVKGILRRLGTHAKRGMGQNFLVDQSVLDQLLATAQVSPADNIIEVGPGLGVLTRALAENAGKVVAVELDEKLAAELEKAMGNWPNVRVVQGDILKLEPWSSVEGSYKVVANLPYNIASPTIRRLLTSPKPPSLIVVMIQKEVAEEIAARPGNMRLLSIMVQFYAKPEIVADVSPQCFFPPPKVSSAILRLYPCDTPPVVVNDPAAFFDLVAAGFRQPRKQLSNSLSQGLGSTAAVATAYLEDSGIDPKRRAETLTLNEWATLWKTVSASRTTST